jgi:hypothetical protein
MDTERSRHPVLLSVLLLGGAAAVGSALLPSVELSSNGISFAKGFVPGTAHGSSFAMGWLIAGSGLALLVTCVLTWLISASARIPGAIALVVGLVLIGAGSLALADLEQRFTDFAVSQTTSESFPEDQVREEMNQLFIQDAVDVKAGVGVWITLAAGTLAASTGLVAVGRRKRSGDVASEVGKSPTSPQDQSQLAEDVVSESERRTEESPRTVGVSRSPAADPRHRQGHLGDSWAG